MGPTRKTSSISEEDLGVRIGEAEARASVFLFSTAVVFLVSAKQRLNFHAGSQIQSVGAVIGAESSLKARYPQRDTEESPEQFHHCRDYPLVIATAPVKFIF
jgi:hypothetical protein